jgi:hypothetical protein
MLTFHIYARHAHHDHNVYLITMLTMLTMLTLLTVLTYASLATSLHVPPDLAMPHCKKGLAVFPSPAGMSLTKLFLGGNNLIFPAQREFGQ